MGLWYATVLRACLWIHQVGLFDHMDSFIVPGEQKASALESSTEPFTCFSELCSPGAHAQALTSISLWVITFVLASGGNGDTFSQSVLGTVLELEVFRSHSRSLSKDLRWSSVALK